MINLGKKQAFTLMELIFVVAIISTIAVIAIPGLLRAKLSANEGSAAVSLRSLVSAQELFSKNQGTDQDGDGAGEYGLLVELTGMSNRRGKNYEQLAPFRPPMLPRSLEPSSTTLAGYATKSGYTYQIFLPGESVIITDGLPDSISYLPDTAVEAINKQEDNWIAYSWPTDFGISGEKAYVVDHTKEVYFSSNMDPATGFGYFYGIDTAHRPNYNTAMSTAVGTPTVTRWTPISVNDAQNTVDTNHIWLSTSS